MNKALILLQKEMFHLKTTKKANGTDTGFPT